MPRGENESNAWSAVSFDATGTLFSCPRVGEIYSEVLGRHGVEIEPAAAARLIRVVWQELDCRSSMERERFGAHPDGERGWWRRFLERFCELLGAPAPSRFLAAEMFDRFARADAWELYPDALPALDRLAGHGVRLAVTSNWDHRLPGILAGLGLAARFEAVVYSADVGVEKPHPEIFRRTLAALELPAASVLHVGDRLQDDVEGARAVGMPTLWLSRRGEGDIASLLEIADRGVA